MPSPGTVCITTTGSLVLRGMFLSFLSFECERLAVDSTNADMKFIYREFAQQCRDVARKVEQLENEQAKQLQSD